MHRDYSTGGTSIIRCKQHDKLVVIAKVTEISRLSCHYNHTARVDTCRHGGFSLTTQQCRSVVYL
jgi:hypothetical protein